MVDGDGTPRNWHLLRPEERHAAAVLEAALPGVIATAHDDSSRAAMHDINLLLDGVVVGAVEVTAAADSDAIELWKLANGSDDRWVVDDLVGGWLVTLLPRAPFRRIKAELPGLLRLLETGAGDVDVTELVASLKVVSCYQGGTAFPGSIYLTIESPDDAVGQIEPDLPATDAVSAWIGGFLGREDQQHNIDKVTAARCHEGHIFVLVPGFTSAPWEVQTALLRDGASTPAGTPQLPDGVTHVWLMSGWSNGAVFSWSATPGWQRHAKVDPPADRTPGR